MRKWRDNLFLFLSYLFFLSYFEMKKERSCFEMKKTFCKWNVVANVFRSKGKIFSLIISPPFLLFIYCQKKFFQKKLKNIEKTLDKLFLLCYYKYAVNAGLTKNKYVERQKDGIL